MHVDQRLASGFSQGEHFTISDGRGFAVTANWTECRIPMVRSTGGAIGHNTQQPLSVGVVH